jgi:hypothetical protein
MLKLKKITPMYNQVLVTEDRYGYDDKNEFNIIEHTKGDIKDYQKVLAVGKDVTCVNVGDMIAVNFARYAELKHKEGSMKDGVISDNPIIELHLNEVELTDENGENVPCFIIDARDIRFIMNDFDEVVYDDNDELIKVQKPSIIVPNK